MFWFVGLFKDRGAFVQLKTSCDVDSCWEGRRTKSRLSTKGFQARAGDWEATRNGKKESAYPRYKLQRWKLTKRDNNQSINIEQKHVPACFQRLTVFLRPPSLLDDPRESGTSPCLQQADCLLIWRIEARTQTLRFIRQQERINNVTGPVHVDRWCITFLHRQYTPSLLWNRTGTRSQQERILSLSPWRSRLLNLMRLQMQTSSMFQGLRLYSKEHTSGFLYEVTVFSRSVKMFFRDRLRSANWIEKVYIYAQQEKSPMILLETANLSDRIISSSSAQLSQVAEQRSNRFFQLRAYNQSLGKSQNKNLLFSLDRESRSALTSFKQVQFMIRSRLESAAVS